VVLTCAMRPASALTPDGPQNLLDAFAVAADPATRGVVAVCAGSVHSAIDVQKIYSYRTDAFDSGDRGPLGYVEEGHVRWVRQAVEWPSVWPVPAVEAVVGQVQWPRVEVVLSHAGADGSVVDALLQDRAGVVPLRGLVAAGTGNGTLHQGLEAALRRAQALGVRVLRTSRCARGHVLGGAEDALPGAGGLSAVKARIALMLALMAPPEPAETALPD
jgi:L-asparaginase